jgi:hypothetical protein
MFGAQRFFFAYRNLSPTNKIRKKEQPGWAGSGLGRRAAHRYPKGGFAVLKKDFAAILAAKPGLLDCLYGLAD